MRRGVRSLVMAASAVATVITAASLSACTIATSGDSESSTAQTTTRTTTVSPSPNPSTSTPAKPETTRKPDGNGDQKQVQAVLDQAVADATAQFGGTAAISLSDGRVTVDAGELSSGPAWSTVKVPLALAAVSAGVADAGAVQRALETSDNAAADQLWNALGGGAAAAGAVEQQIAQVSAAPHVPSEVTRPGFSAFGQANWPVKDQAKFAAKLKCVDRDSVVSTHMAQVTAEQRYGIGRIDGARLKGGWGPNEAGAYLTRQLGVADVNGKQVGIAVAAQPADGSYAAGQGMLDALVQSLTASEAWHHLALGAGDC